MGTTVSPENKNKGASAAAVVALSSAPVTEDDIIDEEEGAGDNEDDHSGPNAAAHQQEEHAEDSSSDNSSHHTHYTVEDLHPPQSASEAYRDRMLRFLDRPIFQTLGLIVLVLVIADGAFFFFLLVGWQAMCRPRTDCEPRNFWYNWSIQMLNVLFTYMAVVTIPWRSTHFLHLTNCSCPHRDNAPGLNLYGVADPDVWFHIPVRRRLGITSLLLGNCVFQFINQGTRFYFYNHELQDSPPGNIWTNVFFVSSFLCAAAAGAWQAYEVVQLRKVHPPGTFGLGPVDTLKEFWRTHSQRKSNQDSNQETQYEHGSDDRESIRDDEDANVNVVDSAAAEEAKMEQGDHHQQQQRRHSGSGAFLDDTAQRIHHRRHHSDGVPSSSALAAADGQHDHRPQHRRHHTSFLDPTRDPLYRHILPDEDRAGLRLWGI